MKFTTDWFDMTKAVWVQLFDQVKPTRYLEIGSFEGMATCFAIDHIGQRGGVVECIDPYDTEYPESLRDFKHDMGEAYDQFNANVQEALAATEEDVKFHLYREGSESTLIRLVAEGNHEYDVIYIDGDHRAKPVLFDCIMAMKLLRRGGLLILDDYLWAEYLGASPLDSPKMAIDVFTTIYCNQLLEVRYAPLYQRYFTKVEIV